jgi:hydroxymethylbilane synthase
VKNRIIAARGFPEDAVTIHVIKTTGDRVLDRPLSEIGGKGLFTKEIEEALLANEIDVAVHSMKDMQTVLSDRLVIGAVLPREDPRDAFICLRHPNFEALPRNSVVGTSSLRRKAQVLHARPDLKVVDFRGNVQTRLRKLEEGIAEATFLAVAGLKRLGLEERITSPVSMEHMLPAVAQGVIGLEIRTGDEAIVPIMDALNDPTTAYAVVAERAFLARLEGSCRTPIGGHAVIDRDDVHFRGQLLSPDGAKCYDVSRHGKVEQARELGLSAADDILSQADAALLVPPNA